MSTPFNVYVREILCRDNTEGGSDEIYLNVRGYPPPRRTTFIPGDVRFPKDRKHWSINNTGDWYKIDYKLPWVQWVEVSWPQRGWKEIAEDKPLRPGAGGGIQSLTFIVMESDDLSDDHIAKFRMEPMLHGGVVWEAKSDCELQHDPRDPVMIVRCWGSDTEYWLKMEYVPVQGQWW